MLACMSSQNNKKTTNTGHFEHVQIVTCETDLTVIYTLCLKKMSHLRLAVVFTYMGRLRQFLTQVLPKKQAIKKYFIFPLHLISASALPGETGNPEIVSFHLNAACFFAKKHETQLKYHLIRAEPPFTVKTIDWVHQTGPRKGA